MSIKFQFVAVAAATLIVGTAGITAASAADFYKGKTISIVIGFSPGGGFDAYGRLVARNMGKYIPGKPKFIAQNMPGAGSLKAVKYLEK